MDRAFEKAIRKYEKRIKALLICDSKTAKSYLQDLDDGIVDFIENSGATSIQEIIARFGTPEAVAREFLETASIRKIKRRMNIKRAVLTGMFIVVAIWAVAVTCLSIDSYRSNHGFIVDSVSKATVTYSQTNK